MKCMMCGREIDSESRLCKYCSMRVELSEISDLEDPTIELTDEDGNSVYLEFLDLITYCGKEYVVLLPEDDNADGIMILQVELLPDGSESYITVDDEQILEVVFEIFKERNKDLFTFAD